MGADELKSGFLDSTIKKFFSKEEGDCAPATEQDGIKGGYAEWQRFAFFSQTKRKLEGRSQIFSGRDDSLNAVAEGCLTSEPRGKGVRMHVAVGAGMVRKTMNEREPEFCE